MKKVIKLSILIITLFLSANKVLAYYSTNDNIVSIFSSKKYAIHINAAGGQFDDPNIVIKENNTVLPSPLRLGYHFLGFSESPTGEVMYTNNIADVNKINNKNLYAKWETILYNLKYNLDGGNATELPKNYNVEQVLTLPQPEKQGYTFAGWTGTGLSQPTKNVTLNKSVGDREYIANWNKNYYTVNYYVNNNLWAQRTVGFGDTIENLNVQGSLDGYHTFHGWNNWVDRMPDHSIDLYANISEAYCRLATGHGPYGNATALLNVFRSAGWTGAIVEAETALGNYMVVTDYTLTRAQAEVQKNYIASHTNYNNYNFPYLYWVSIGCTNGYGEAWTRSSGQSSFN